jgi:hypothetical protein
MTSTGKLDSLLQFCPRKAGYSQSRRYPSWIGLSVGWENSAFNNLSHSRKKQRKCSFGFCMHVLPLLLFFSIYGASKGWSSNLLFFNALISSG